MAEFWICLVKVSQGFEYASGSKHVVARNMARLWIRKGYTGWWICLNKPEYASIMLKMLEYASISLNTQGLEYARILNVSEAVHSIRLLFKMLSRQRNAIETETYSKHCQTFKMKRFANVIMPECMHANINFSGQGRFFLQLG